MDDRIGRLVANIGVDRTATEKAVRIVEQLPFRVRPARRARLSWNRSTGSLRTIRGTHSLYDLSGICVSFNGVTTVRSRRMTATARLCAAAAFTGEANDHAREQARASAAGEVAGAILGRSQQI